MRWGSSMQVCVDASHTMLACHAAGTIATKRLAARLLPRFIHKFPHSIDPVASALMALHGNVKHLAAGSSKHQEVMHSVHMAKAPACCLSSLLLLRKPFAPHAAADLFPRGSNSGSDTG